MAPPLAPAERHTVGTVSPHPARGRTSGGGVLTRRWRGPLQLHRHGGATGNPPGGVLGFAGCCGPRVAIVESRYTGDVEASFDEYRLVVDRPERLSLKILMALLDILDCRMEELIEPVAAAKAAAARKRTASGEEAGIGDLRPKRARITRVPG